MALVGRLRTYNRETAFGQKLSVNIALQFSQKWTHNNRFVAKVNGGGPIFPVLPGGRNASAPKEATPASSLPCAQSSYREGRRQRTCLPGRAEK